MPEHIERTPRTESSSPPTLMMQGYEAMGHTGRRRLRWAGFAMITVSVGIPLIAGIWVAFPIVYWLFSGAVALSGTCFVFPQLGLQLIEVIPGFIAKVVPTRLLSRPDRRSEDRDE